MAEESDIPIALIAHAFFGSKSGERPGDVLLGFVQPDGVKFGLSIPQNAIDEVISELVKAKSAFPPPSRIGESHEFAMAVQMADVGFTASTGDVFVRLRFPSGGFLGISLDKTLAAGLAEQLAANAGTLSVDIPPSTTRN